MPIEGNSAGKIEGYVQIAVGDFKQTPIQAHGSGLVLGHIHQHTKAIALAALVEHFDSGVGISDRSWIIGDDHQHLMGSVAEVQRIGSDTGGGVDYHKIRRPLQRTECTDQAGPLKFAQLRHVLDARGRGHNAHAGGAGDNDIFERAIAVHYLSQCAAGIEPEQYVNIGQAEVGIE